MKTLTLFLFALTVSIGVPQMGSRVAAQDPAKSTDQATLPRGTLRQLDEVIFPAHMNGWRDVFADKLSPLIEKLNSDQLEALERYGKSQGIDSVQRAFVNVRLQAVEQGMNPKIEKLKPAMAGYIAAGVASRVKQELDEIARRPIMQDPLTLPADWRESDKLFWSSHVLKNRFANLHRLAEYSRAVAAPHLKRARKNKNANAIAVLEPMEKLVVDVERMHRDLVEREAELRLVELTKAEATLKTSTDFETRLNAAFALENHGSELEKFFRENPPGNFHRDKLNDLAALEYAGKLFASGRKLGKQEIEKASLLRMGAHWWLRGRYGMAPMGKGLLKSPAAMKSEQAMFGLFMPKERPDPITSAFIDEESSSGYDRRHYYTWAVEYRPRLKSVTKASAVTGIGPTSTRFTGEYFW